MKLKKKPAMTAAELVATRERMGWDRARLAEELGLLPAELDAMEGGSIAISRQVADVLPELELAYERQRILDESGLLPCADADALAATVRDAFRGGDPDASHQAVQALLRHERRCGVCQARAEHLRVHGPPDLPAPRTPWWLWPFRLADALVDRLPGRLRPPEDGGGEHRRTGVFIGAYLTVAAVVIVAVRAVRELVDGRVGEDSALGFVPVLPVLAAAYLAGGYLAGAAWDFTRGIRHRLSGYVLRGGATAAALYGAMGLVIPFIDVEMSLGMYGTSVGILTVLGALFGAGKWMRDRWTDNLPDPVATPAQGATPVR